MSGSSVKAVSKSHPGAVVFERSSASANATVAASATIKLHLPQHRLVAPTQAFLVHHLETRTASHHRSSALALPRLSQKAPVAARSVRLPTTRDYTPRIRMILVTAWSREFAFTYTHILLSPKAVVFQSRCRIHRKAFRKTPSKVFCVAID